MKKILLFTMIAAFLGLFTIANAQNVTIPNAIFKAALVGNTAINTNADADIQVTEAAAYTGSIRVGSMSINDLTGIEAFTAIDSLVCNVNQLTSLNISTCTALKYLNCDWNSLASLNVSSNTLLTGLNCTSNQLTSLNVSANTALVILGCGFNKITSLNVSQNTALTTLVCFYDSIGSLDVSTNTQLTYFDCSKNKLTSLNMQNGNNINLQSGFGFNSKNNPNLTCIQVDNVAFMTTNWNNAKPTAATYSTLCAGTGIANLGMDEMTIYPNPFSSQLTFALEDNAQTTVTLYDLVGKQVLKQNFTNSATVHTALLADGIYLYELRNSNGTLKTGKVVKQ